MNSHYTKEHITSLNYKGLPIYSTLGVHEEVFEYVRNNFAKDCSILLFGCGSGAFEQRLFDNGYLDVSSCDFSKDNFRLPNLSKFFEIDFNSEFNSSFNGIEFDLIILIDVIEHTYSIFNLINNISKILSDGGNILMATPNIHSTESIANSIIFGGPISHEGIPFKFEHFSIPSYGIIKAISNDVGLYEVESKSILKSNFNVPESLGIKTLRCISRLFVSFIFKISNLFEKIEGTEISKFIGIEKQKELREGFYILTNFKKGKN